MTTETLRFGRRVFTAVLIVGLTVAVIYSIHILLLALAGILLAILLRTAGTWLSRISGLSVNWSMAIVLAGFGFLFFGGLAMFGVQIVGQADKLFGAVSDAYGELRQKLAQYQLAGSVSPENIDLQTPAAAAASGVIWTAASVVLVLFLGLYLSMHPYLYTDLFLSFFDKRLQNRIFRLLDAMASALQWWLLGQFIAMATVGVITTAGLLLIGAPMPISLGILAGILTFVPYVGAIVSAIPAVLLALTVSSNLAMYVIGVYTVAHIIEGYIVVPLIQHRLVYLPPAMILAFQFLMHVFAGIVGVTLATPLMVVGMVLIKKLYFKQDWDEPAAEEAA